MRFISNGRGRRDLPLPSARFRDVHASLLVFSKSDFKTWRSAGIDPVRYHLLSAAGWLFGILVGYVCVAMVFLLLTPGRKGWGIPIWVVLCGTLVCGLVSATTGPALSYLILWVRTARDPDYDDRMRRKKPSQIADISQPRDGDDVRPE